MAGELDLYEQGIERTLRFDPNGPRVAVACSSRNASFEPAPVSVRLERSDVLQMLRSCLDAFVSVLHESFPAIANHPWVAEWLLDEGLWKLARTQIATPDQSAASTGEVLRRALQIAPQDSVRALAELELGLQHTRTRGDAHAVAVLAKHAAAIAHGSGHREMAICYFREAATASPDDPSILIGLGVVYRNCGLQGIARSIFTRSLELAERRGDVDMIEVATVARDET